MTILSRLNQLKFKKDFRIKSGLKYKIAPSELIKLEKYIDGLSKKVDQFEQEKENTLVNPETMTDLITGIWRARKNMIKPGAKEPIAELRMAFRHLQSVMDLLKDKGFDIIDHLNESVKGKSVRVLTFEPTEGIKQEQVIETVRPTIYFKDKLLQIADVVVGMPKD